MPFNQETTHQELVSFWEEKNIKNLSTDQAIQVYGSALQAIEQRCLATLSSVTMQVVLDRIIYQGLEQFPFFKELTLEPAGLNFNNLIQKKDLYDLKDINTAFRYLLIELLTVIGKITSEVLTVALHKELMEVTSESALRVLDVQVLRPSNTAKKRGGK